MAKRGQGEGTISKRPDGTWWARISIGYDAQGKRRRKAFYGKTRKEVQEKLTAALNEINTGIYIEPSRMTVEQWLDVWLNDYKKLSLKQKTYSNYSNIIRLYINPEIGDIKLKDLNGVMVQKFIAKTSEKNTFHYAERKIAPKTVQSVYSVLKSALEQAVYSDMIVKNPANNVELPKNDGRQARVLTAEEQGRFIEACKDSRYGNFFIFLLATGLRLGEGAGLTWNDIDYEERIVDINKTLLAYWEYGNNYQTVTYGSPKTKSGIRKVPLMPVALQILEEVKKTQEIEKIMAGDEYQDNNLIFCTRKGTTTERSYWHRAIKEICARAELEGVHAHTLRHTFATRCLENGIDLKIVQSYLGHASIKMTADVYTHVLPEHNRAAIKKLENSIKL